jgi:hypothetical protein
VLSIIFMLCGPVVIVGGCCSAPVGMWGQLAPPGMQRRNVMGHVRSASVHVCGPVQAAVMLHQP